MKCICSEKPPKGKQQVFFGHSDELCNTQNWNGIRLPKLNLKKCVQKKKKYHEFRKQIERLETIQQYPCDIKSIIKSHVIYGQFFQIFFFHILKKFVGMPLKIYIWLLLSLIQYARLNDPCITLMKGKFASA